MQDQQPPESVKQLLTHLPALFIFSLVWSVGATANLEGRRRFNAILRQEMAAHSFPFPFPEAAPGGAEGSAVVYDFVWNPTAPAVTAAAPAAGAPAANSAAATGAWVPWMSTVPPYEYPAKGSASVDFSELIIPTKENK